MLLEAAREGDSEASGRLFEVVYAELRRLAAHKMTLEARNHTLQPTALVHEAWLRLGADAQPNWRNRAHFFAAASEAMRRILIDAARRKSAKRRGEGTSHVDVEDLQISAPADDERLLELNEALDRFAEIDSEKAEFVKLRYFLGLSLEDSAEALGISTATAKRRWTYARAWLIRELTWCPNDPGSIGHKKVES